MPCGLCGKNLKLYSYNKDESLFPRYYECEDCCEDGKAYKICHYSEDHVCELISIMVYESEVIVLNLLSKGYCDILTVKDDRIYRKLRIKTALSIKSHDKLVEKLKLYFMLK